MLSYLLIKLRSSFLNPFLTSLINKTLLCIVYDLTNVIMVQDVRKFYNCKIGSIGDMEIREAYKKLCENGVLKE